MHSLRLLSLGLLWIAMTGCAFEVTDPMNEEVNPEDLAEASDPLSTVTAGTTFYRGTDPYHALEVYGALPDGYILTGIGGRVGPGGNMTTLRLRGQAINASGALGNEYDWHFGSEPYHALEAFYEVPAGSGIVGVAMRELDDNLTTMVVYYRYYSASMKRFTGSPYIKRVGSEPNGPIEVLFGIWEEQNALGNIDKFSFKGVGARVGNGAVTTLVVTAGHINL